MGAAVNCQRVEEAVGCAVVGLARVAEGGGDGRHQEEEVEGGGAEGFVEGEGAFHLRVDDGGVGRVGHG